MRQYNGCGTVVGCMRPAACAHNPRRTTGSLWLLGSMLKRMVSGRGIDAKTVRWTRLYVFRTGRPQNTVSTDPASQETHKQVMQQLSRVWSGTWTKFVDQLSLQGPPGDVKNGEIEHLFDLVERCDMCSSAVAVPVPAAPAACRHGTHHARAPVLPRQQCTCVDLWAGP